MNTLHKFTGLYPLSKTLRFELKPIGKTLEYIEKHGLLEQDQRRADNYIEVKEIIDRYHKHFIDESLNDFKLRYDDNGKKDSLEEYYFYYKLQNRDDRQKKDFEDVQKNLRKQIASQLKGKDKFKRIDKKELIKEDLIDFVRDEQEKSLISEFSNFTTYFTGFHENRQNMYSDEDKSTAIAYRMIHENLPKFIDNISIFERVAASELSANFSQIYADFESYLNVNEISELFRLDYFSEVLTQNQIDAYNLIIGGKSEDKAKNGLNVYINHYNQKQKDKSLRLPILKPLFKQILSDRNAISWLPESFENDNQLLEKLEKCYQAFVTDYEDKKSLFERLKQMLLSIADFDTDKMFVRNDLQLTDISQKMFGNYDVINRALLNELKKTVQRKSKKETDENYEERLKKIIKDEDSFSIGIIDTSLSGTIENYNESVCDYFKNLSPDDSGKSIFDRIENAYESVKDLLNTQYPSDKNLAQDKENVEKIKNLLDLLKELQAFVKPLCGKGNESDKDERFYGEFSVLWEELDKITPLYNMVRNYLTRKPYSTKKIKLNFENAQLLSGWDLNKESDNTCVILRKDGLYYLAIMNKKHNKVFEKNRLQTGVDCYEKMEYKLLPGANKMLPKVFFSKSRIHEFNPSEKLLSNYNNETHKKGDKFNIHDCHELIDFFKSSIDRHEDWSKFGFNFSETKSYEDLSGFYREVEHQGYKISFCNVSVDYVNSLVDEGKIYLFQIYNKDFSAFSKGTPNLHTLYWKMLFDDNNLRDVVYKLNGQAEVFYRKSSVKHERPTHPANVPIDNKNSLREKKQSVFKYDLIKDRRYTVDKFQFHVPITMNFKSNGTEIINPLVNEHIKNSDNMHIIGIDRGERHLLYLSLIDMKGNIVHQYSLNNITNEYNKTNYHDLLEKREAERDKERKSWKKIESIKELKEGYLSQVIHRIAELMVEYNAIVVLENLSDGFKRGRQKFEKSVYQKFEKMLIDKLNYLVDKKKAADDLGGVLKAYQLTNKFESFKKLGKQSGFLFYTQAWNTSKIDPVTGFVNLFDTRYENIAKAKSFFAKFDSIRYNADKNYFEFAFDYDNFTTKAEGTKTQWTVCTFGNRVISYRNPEKISQWDYKEIVLTDEFKAFFEKYGIDIYSDLQSEIERQDRKDFFEELLHLFRLTLQMRNSKTGTAVDYMQSPVADENGVFYNSDKCGKSLPENADANGAYNIARKGLMIIDKIKHSEDMKTIDLKVSNKEWLNFAQNKPYLKD